MKFFSRFFSRKPKEQKVDKPEEKENSSPAEQAPKAEKPEEKENPSPAKQAVAPQQENSKPPEKFDIRKVEKGKVNLSSLELMADSSVGATQQRKGEIDPSAQKLADAVLNKALSQEKANGQYNTSHLENALTGIQKGNKIPEEERGKRMYPVLTDTRNALMEEFTKNPPQFAGIKQREEFVDKLAETLRNPYGKVGSETKGENSAKIDQAIMERSMGAVKIQGKIDIGEDTINSRPLFERDSKTKTVSLSLLTSPQVKVLSALDETKLILNMHQESSPAFSKKEEAVIEKDWKKFTQNIEKPQAIESKGNVGQEPRRQAQTTEEKEPSQRGGAARISEAMGKGPQQKSAQEAAQPSNSMSGLSAIRERLQKAGVTDAQPSERKGPEQKPAQRPNQSSQNITSSVSAIREKLQKAGVENTLGKNPVSGHNNSLPSNKDKGGRGI